MCYDRLRFAGMAGIQAASGTKTKKPRFHVRASLCALLQFRVASSEVLNQAVKAVQHEPFCNDANPNYRRRRYNRSHSLWLSLTT
jgi:hypothetical protein